MSRFLRPRAQIAALTAAALALPALALADTVVVNDVQLGSADATKSVGQTGTVAVSLTPDGNDGVNGCNASGNGNGSGPVVLELRSSSSAVTLSSTTVSLAGCTTPATVTYRAAGEGSATISAVYVSGGKTGVQHAGAYDTRDTLRVVVTGKADQAIHFDAAVTGVTYGDAPFDAGARATSSLPVALASATPDVCAITDGGRVDPLAAGTCTVRATQGGDARFNAAPTREAAYTVARRPVSGGFSAADRPYDGTDAAEVTGRDVEGELDGDAVALSGGEARFAATRAGTHAVALTGASLGGADAANYTLSSVAPTSADITRRVVTGGFTAAGKVYDGTNAASITARSVDGRVDGDELALDGGAATFATEDAGRDKRVALTGATLTGADAGNYRLGGVDAATASIDPKAVTGSFATADKVYDGTRQAAAHARSLDGLVDGDTVALEGGTAAFDTEHAGRDKPVALTGAALAGDDAGNYALEAVGGQTATVEPRPVTGTFTAAGKVYDGTNAASITARSVDGRVDGDELALDGGAATFATEDAGSGHTVTGRGFGLSGADAGDYVLVSGTLTTTASIAPKVVDGGFSAADKEFDRSTAAVIAERRVTGVIAGDDVVLTSGSAAFADALAGAAKPVHGSGFALGGAAADVPNYVLRSTALVASATIRPWPFGGFLQPIDSASSGVLNLVKAGSAVPVKFALGGDRGLDVIATGYPRAVRIPCDAGASLDPVPTATATTSGLKFDILTGQYNWTWKTATAYAGTCQRFELRLADGTVRTADFRFAK